MKRIISFALVLAMLLSCMPLSVFAADGTEECTIKVETVAGVPGSATKVSVIIENNPGILGATLKLSWDAGLTLTSVECGDAFSMLNMTKPNKWQTSGGNYIFYGEALDDHEVIDGSILDLTFTVDAAAEFGTTYGVRISYESGDIFDKDLNVVEPTVVNGGVDITYLPGDVNGDKRINALDLILLCRFIADGSKNDPDSYNTNINELAGDVDANGRWNALDLILICRYIADGCKTDPNGYNVELKPSGTSHTHRMTVTEEKTATCTDDGNIAYWYCTGCSKYFRDEAGTMQISYADTVVKAAHKPGAEPTCTEAQVCTVCGEVLEAATGHTEETVKGYAPTYDSEGLSDGIKCSVCGKWIKEQEELPPLLPDEYVISYNYRTNAGSEYLEKQVIDNPNPTVYTTQGERVELQPVSVLGYKFNGWYDKNGNIWDEIPSGTSGNLILYGDFTLNTYTIQYESDMVSIQDDTYDVTKAKSLPTKSVMQVDRYTWVGWSDKNGNMLSEIPAGTTGDLILYANWSSHRNQAQAVNELKDPIIVEDSDNGIILFNYHIGTIKNIPLYEIMRLNCVNGVISTYSISKSEEIGQERAESIASIISNATTNSTSWTLSSEWNSTTEVSDSFLEESGMTREDAEKLAKSESNEYNVGKSYGEGNTYASTDTHTYKINKGNSGSNTSTSENSSSIDLSVDAKVSTSVKAGVVNYGAEISAGIATNDSSKNSSSGTSGWDKDEEESDLSSSTSTSTKSWNTNEGYTLSSDISSEKTIANVVTNLISEAHNIGNSYAEGGSNSNTKDLASTQEKTSEFGSSITYYTTAIETVEKSISTTGSTTGDYRYIMAGTAEVYAAVGYNVADNNYFVYTYSLLDDETYEIVDYSYDSSFNDYETSIIPFEVPYFVNEYVNSRIAKTDGFVIDTETGIIEEYTRWDNQVIAVPSYVAVSNDDGTYRSVKIKGISSSLFKNHDEIIGVVFSNFVKEIPTSAFEGCTSLKYVVCPGVTKIGNYAFNGCTSLSEFALPSKITAIGKDAFAGVSKISSVASSAEVAKAVTASGADNIVLDISEINEADMNIEAGNISYFELQGKNKEYINLRVTSDAAETVINGVKFVECINLPIRLSSPTITFNRVTVDAKGYAMILAADNSNVKMQGTIALSTEGSYAVVCKNISLSPLNTSYIGKMAVNGDVLVCGSVEGSKYLTVTDNNNNTYETISEEEFAMYEKGMFTITFDANGGNVDTVEITAFCGTAVGTLPTPTKTGFTFGGWYTSAGEQITADSKLVSDKAITVTAKWNAIAYTASWNTGNGYSITVNRTSSPNANAATGTLASGATVYYGDVLSVTYTRADYYTITSNGVTSITVNGNITASDIYASATLKDIKGWTVASKVSSDAQITDTKWTYTLKEETSTTNPDSINENDGWRWKSSARTGWGPTQGPVYTKPTSGSQNIVKEESYVSGYEKMTQYQYSRYLNYEGSKGYSYSNGGRCYPISSGYCTYGPYYTGWVNTPFLIRENSSLSSCGHMHGGSATANYDSLGLTWYNEETRTVDNPDKPIYGTRWYYQDAVYTHYYYRYVENKTAYEDPTGWTNVSSVVKWVMYREK